MEGFWEIKDENLRKSLTMNMSKFIRIINYIYLYIYIYNF